MRNGLGWGGAFYQCPPTPHSHAQEIYLPDLWPLWVMAPLEPGLDKKIKGGSRAALTFTHQLPGAGSDKEVWRLPDRSSTCKTGTRDFPGREEKREGGKGKAES